MMWLVLNDIDEAREAGDVEALAQARNTETQVTKGCELIFAHGKDSHAPETAEHASPVGAAACAGR